MSHVDLSIAPQGDVLVTDVSQVLMQVPEQGCTKRKKETNVRQELE